MLLRPVIDALKNLSKIASINLPMRQVRNFVRKRKYFTDSVVLMTVNLIHNERA